MDIESDKRKKRYGGERKFGHAAGACESREGRQKGGKEGNRSETSVVIDAYRGEMPKLILGLKNDPEFRDVCK